VRITRRPGESFIINLNVRVTIDAIKDGRVRLTVEAPENVPVCGEEVMAKLSQAANDALDGPKPEEVSTDVS
jgi:carbon storage regulator CsrA